MQREFQRKLSTLSKVCDVTWTDGPKSANNIGRFLDKTSPIRFKCLKTMKHTKTFFQTRHFTRTCKVL